MPRASHAGALRALAGRDLVALASTVDAQVAGEGVCFHSAVGDEAFVIDPVPRVIGARRVGDDRGRPRPARARAQRVHRRRLREAADRRRGRRAGARDRHGRVPRARDERRASARGHLDRHLRARPGARRARQLPGARGQRAHPQRLLLRGRRPARARRPARPRARGRAAAAGRSPGAAALRARGRRADPGPHARIALLTDGPRTPPTTSTSGPPRRSASRCSSRRSWPRATTSTSSTAARTPIGSTRRSAGCCSTGSARDGIGGRQRLRHRGRRRQVNPRLRRGHDSLLPA